MDSSIQFVFGCGEAESLTYTVLAFDVKHCPMPAHDCDGRPHGCQVTGMDVVKVNTFLVLLENPTDASQVVRNGTVQVLHMFTNHSI